MRRSLFALLLIFASTVYSASADTAPQMYRPFTNFSRSAIRLYDTVRLRELQKLNETPPSAKTNEIQAHLLEFINFLLDQTNLKSVMNNPAAIIINFKDSDVDAESIPRADIRAGVLSINRLMLAAVRNDDELAAVLGHEALHHTLAHDLEVAELLSKSYMRWMLKHDEQGISWMQTRSFFGSIAEGKIESTKEANENEANLALPYLLIKGGFDPWSIVELNERLLRLTENAPHFLIDPYTRTKFTEETEKIRAQLVAMGAKSHDQHKSDRLAVIQALLR